MKLKKTTDEIDFEMKSQDGKVSVSFTRKISTVYRKILYFLRSMRASKFFEKGSLGYSPRKNRKKLDGIYLQIENWDVSAFELDTRSFKFLRQPDNISKRINRI